MTEFQEKYGAMYKDVTGFGKEHPAFIDAAREALRPWEQNKQLLIHAVAAALLAMYERGAAGDYPEVLLPRETAPAPAPTVLRRQRVVAPTPPVAPTVLRRGRRIA